jgi:uracil phosphoribosyltransferase
MPVYNLSNEFSVLDIFLSEIRDVNIQKDRMRFRRNIERIGEIMAFEISKTLSNQLKEIQTPIAKMQVKQFQQLPVLATILRAGLPLHQGFMNYFDGSDAGFISAYRHHLDQGFEIKVEYLAAPSLENKDLILIDPMLATGKSITSCLAQIQKLGKPHQLLIAAVLATPEGIEEILSKFPDAEIYCAAIDQGLNEHQYIVPGLGDAGDLCFGEKISSI